MARQRKEKPSERICAQRFVDWYNSQNGTAYAIERAELVFPDLVGQTRWEFVARQSNSAKWVAIEVKQLRLLGLDRPWSDWRKLCAQVTERVQGRLRGTVFVHLPPSLSFNQQEKEKLISVLTDVIVGTISALRPGGEMKDVSPDVAKRFPRWPQQRSSLEEYEQWGEYRPSSVYLTLESNQGCEVRLFGISSGGDGVQAHDRALCQVFDTQDGVQANRQLAVAKTKGADWTVLLLDCEILYQERYIRQFLESLASPALSAIDQIYLVGNKGVVKVYPS